MMSRAVALANDDASEMERVGGFPMHTGQNPVVQVGGSRISTRRGRARRVVPAETF